MYINTFIYIFHIIFKDIYTKYKDIWIPFGFLLCLLISQPSYGVAFCISVILSSFQVAASKVKEIDGIYFASWTGRFSWDGQTNRGLDESSVRDDLERPVPKPPVGKGHPKKIVSLVRESGPQNGLSG